MLKTHNLEEDPKLFCEECEVEASDNVCPHIADHQLHRIIEKKSNKIRLSPRSGDRAPRLCQFQPCRNGIKCFYPHGDKEFQLWSDMKYINDAVYNPRPKSPKPQLAPKMCTNMTEKGRCSYKEKCDYAHSEGELKKWKEQFDKDNKSKYKSLIHLVLNTIIEYEPKIEEVKVSL